MRLYYRGYPLIFALAILVSLNFFAPPAHGQVGINIFGLSHHFDNDLTTKPKDINPGLGLHWTFDRGRRTSLEVNAGMYHDSFRNTNRHAGLGARVKVWGPVEVGLHSTLSKSDSFGCELAMLHPMPFLAFRHRRLVINTIYIPEVDGVNGVATLGFTATVFPFGNGFVWDDAEQISKNRASALEFSIGGLTELDNIPGMGIAWRRMFNAKQGLRLGFDLEGMVTLGDHYHGGYYETHLLAQYLHRLSDKKKSSGYFAPGIRLNYRSGNLSSEMAYDFLFNLGWDYRLNSRFSIFLESDISLSIRKQAESTERSSIHYEKSTTLGSQGIILGVTAWL